MVADQKLMLSLWDLGYSPINIKTLEKYLNLYMQVNKDDAQLLLSGFTEGFRLQYTGPRIPRFSKNLISADMHPTETLQLLKAEVDMGRMLGPFSNIPISTLRISPIGLVEKSDHSWRLITHLSFPEGLSVNDFIDEKHSKVHYSSFDNITEMVSELGKGAELGKVDIHKAFRLLPINPADFDLLGIMFQGKIYIDKNLPFGCSISCALFEKFATFLHWVIKYKSTLPTLDHYLDDFFFSGKAGTENCRKLMDEFMVLSKELCVPLAINKTVGPTTKLTFLGLEIDTVFMLIRIPDNKLNKLKSGIFYLLGRQKIQLRELESVVGLMAFCARAIPSARAFLRRFYDLIASVKIKKPYYYIRVNKEVKADARVWLTFLCKFNGECYLPEKFWLSSDKLELYTDASGNASLGCAAFFNGFWVQIRWPKTWAGKGFLAELSFLELVPVLLALLTWKSSFVNKKLLLRIDNEALVAIINKRTSKSKHVMQLIRPLVLLTMQHNIQFKAVHIAGAKNEISDSLSRFQMERFRSLAPRANKTPSDIPVEFWDVISTL